MILKNKKVGIWGFGSVGKSVAHVALQEGASLLVCDQSPICPQDLTTFRASFISQEQFEDFTNECDFIIPSPGINQKPLTSCRATIIQELDLFYDRWHPQPIIAITGSVGKTSITTILGQLLTAYNYPITIGGNIGYAALNLLDNRTPETTALLEVSSFQLEYCNRFAPDLAIISNIHPNHLDRHETMENYIAAKAQMIKNQNKHQKIIIPLSLWPHIKQVRDFDPAHIIFFSLTKPEHIQNGSTYYWLENKHIMKNNSLLFDLTKVPRITFAENWLIIIAIIDNLKLPLSSLPEKTSTLKLPPHRMELVSNRRNLTIYNDSKSTTIAGTLAALTLVPDKMVHLFIGGLSKGADRAPLIQQLPKNITHVYCFGKEAEVLATLCKTYNVPYSLYHELESAVQTCLQNMHADDALLFSPSGSSYDLFTNFEQRGAVFKMLIDKYTA